ncbi:hypothetical protein NEPAR06_2330 [Nematocida parisii]|uniref:Uncharacterized protein n=1 Tax=Nematocida parisii (strain ERTm3) TaxID=935791 RepID=I3EFU4_NEMP3|nr:uncharacterized protein NEPG_01415 [Nematocida parisii ERTm1]EIJ88091.1 hypothetical protein NEQG_01535 [Nematocida parisii ERTm3]KAI5131157.1 hypothetical protein NEPAR08_2351 [Nematocida parisii]EIJ93843.1 hypothetical protein NEPG_01415 [Nematocida parisii ERTm1]KAI5131218.1 hypothetical protein NEPAR03_2344 [Nematocida parisii]KAI5144886.1 hypothetical protein NEPAR04_2251 [Nematocida parisii]|eukprot:XP_013059243.1 hypothetical protein NEPG_01415 [Nematocida parisii ERTm1]
MKIISVASGKGGVGKSTIAYLLATHASKTKKTLLLDFDICGPSVGVLMGHTTEKVLMQEKGFKPIEKTPTLFYLTIAAMIPANSAVVWRAPKKISLLKMFLESASLEEYDYLIIDMPPGVTDEHDFLCEQVPDANILIVTTSQNLALDEAADSIKMFQNRNMYILGLIENMRLLKCPNCHNCTAIFSKRGGEMLCDDLNIRYIGHVDYIPEIETNDVMSISEIFSSVLSYVQ